jgi:hypothetical protein
MCRRDRLTDLRDKICDVECAAFAPNIVPCVQVCEEAAEVSG